MNHRGHREKKKMEEEDAIMGKVIAAAMKCMVL
jgi:hypothetical protein